MAQNEPTWSLGESKVFTSSGATVGDGDPKWSFGESSLFHEFVAAGGVTGAILKYWSGSAWANVNWKRWDGATWAAVSLYYYNGTSFAAVQCNG